MIDEVDEKTSKSVDVLFNIVKENKFWMYLIANDKEFKPIKELCKIILTVSFLIIGFGLSTEKTVFLYDKLSCSSFDYCSQNNTCNDCIDIRVCGFEVKCSGECHVDNRQTKFEDINKQVLIKFILSLIEMMLSFFPIMIHFIKLIYILVMKCLFREDGEFTDFVLLSIHADVRVTLLYPFLFSACIIVIKVIDSCDLIYVVFPSFTVILVFTRLSLYKCGVVNRFSKMII